MILSIVLTVPIRVDQKDGLIIKFRKATGGGTYGFLIAMSQGSMTGHSTTAKQMIV